MSDALTPGATASLDLRDLHAANIARQAEWCPDQVPDLSFRGNELAGETGEACNVIKKLERERQGWRGSRATKDDLAQELADVVICADLCAVTAGIDLAAAVTEKFNATSEKQGLATKLAALAPPAVPQQAEDDGARALWVTYEMARYGGSDPSYLWSHVTDEGKRWWRQVYAAARTLLAAQPAGRVDEGALADASDPVDAWFRHQRAANPAPAPDSGRGAALRDWLGPRIEMAQKDSEAHPQGSSNRAFYLGQAVAYGNALSALDAAPTPPVGKDEGWRTRAANEIDGIADLWSGDGRAYAKTIAAILRSECPAPPAGEA